MFIDDTLADLKARDVDNLVDLVKKSAVTLYQTDPQKLHVAIMMKMAECLRKFGVDLDRYAADLTENRFDDQLEALLASKKIKIEFRQYQTLEDAWRSGIYVYREGEIIFFAQLLGDGAVPILTNEGNVYSGKYYSRVKLED